MWKKLTKNIGWKLASLIIATFLWIVIVNVIDPTTTKTFDNIPVKVINETAITSANQVYEVSTGKEISLKVKGKRSIVEGLNASDFEATADLSKLSKVNAVNIDVKVKKVVDGDLELDWNNSVMKLKLEERVSKKYKVEIESTGSLSENYELGSMIAKPNIVEVSCGKSVYKKIDHVGVVVELNGESENFDREYTPILYDSNNDIIDDANVSFSNETIKVAVKVLQTKEIDIKVSPIGQPKAGYRLDAKDYKPEKVAVYGAESIMNNISSITIPISIENASKTIQKEISISKYLPDGISLAGDVETLSVSCVIQKKGMRKYVISVSDIASKNIPADCSVEFQNEDEKFSVTIVGKEKILSKIDSSDLGAYMDLSGCAPGFYEVKVKFNLPSGINVKNKIQVPITLKKQSSVSHTAQ